MFGGSLLPNAFRIPASSPSPNAFQGNNNLPHSQTPSPTNLIGSNNILQNHLQNPQFQTNQQQQQNFQQFQPIQNNFNNLSPAQQPWPPAVNVTTTDTLFQLANNLTNVSSGPSKNNNANTMENRNDVEMPSNMSSFLDMDSQQLNINSSDLSEISRMLGITNSNQLSNNNQFNMQAEEENMTDSFTRLTTSTIDEITKLGNNTNIYNGKM